MSVKSRTDLLRITASKVNNLMETWKLDYALILGKASWRTRTRCTAEEGTPSTPAGAENKNKDRGERDTNSLSGHTPLLN